MGMIISMVYFLCPTHPGMVHTQLVCYQCKLSPCACEEKIQLLEEV